MIIVIFESSVATQLRF